MLYRLATVGAPRGLKGEVRLILHTDDPATRLAPGTEVHTDPDRGHLVIARLIERGDTHYAVFEGHTDRTAAETLVHTVLLAEGREEDDAWYADDLAGLEVRRTSGEVVGTVTGLEHYPAQDLLVIKETSGATTLVPFVHEIVTDVDVEAGHVIIEAPHGLLAADGQDA